MLRHIIADSEQPRVWIARFLRICFLFLNRVCLSIFGDCLWIVVIISHNDGAVEFDNDNDEITRNNHTQKTTNTNKNPKRVKTQRPLSQFNTTPYKYAYV